LSHKKKDIRKDEKRENGRNRIPIGGRGFKKQILNKPKPMTSPFLRCNDFLELRYAIKRGQVEKNPYKTTITRGKGWNTTF
jgi:hypothetical protein